MTRSACIAIALVSALLLMGATPPKGSTGSSQTSSSVCTLADGKQMSVRYIREPVGKEKLHDGDVWTPGGSQMLLFTQTTLTVGTSEIPIGAYSLYFIPEKEQWTLVVNKNVTAGSKYDEQQDLFRSPMEMGSLGQGTKRVKVTLVHAAPKQCNMRLYRGRVGVWAEFKER